VLYTVVRRIGGKRHAAVRAAPTLAFSQGSPAE
jgi:hypothetical protein